MTSETSAAPTSELLDLLFEERSAGRCLVAPDGRVLRANESWLRSTGLSLGDALGADVVGLLAGPRDVAPSTYARARAGHRVEVPRHARRIAGRETWWEGSIDPVPMEGGTGLLVTLREVAADAPADGREPAAPPPGGPRSFAAEGGASSAEEERDRLAEQRQLALDAARMGWWHYDPVTRTASFDRRYTEIFGVTGRERPNEELLKLLHPDDLPRVLAAVESALDPVDPKPYSIEYRVVRPNGAVRWVEAHGLAAFEGEGPARRATRLVGTVADVTERKTGEAELQESTALLQAISDTSHDVIFAKDRAGRMRFANPATLALIGKPLEDVLGRTDLELLDDEAAARQVMENDRRIMESGVGEELEERVPMPDRVERVWLSRKSPYRDAAGNVVGLLGISRDITERKRTEEALRDADRRKGEFLAVLSHELRNPLAPIRNGIHLLERAAPGSAQAARAREIVRRQAEHLTRLVDDLLDITRISRGKIELRRARVDLREVADRTTDDLHSLFEQSRVALRVERSAGPVWVDADPTRIAQVLGNLLHNAVNFTPAGGTVTVTISARDGRAELDVRDDGVGMDPVQVEAMFEPFAQADQNLARTKGGLGLGLALVKGLVELHGGTVQARSGGIGRGAEFAVTLPLSSARAAAADGAEPATAHGRVVLVIEDNADAGQSLADLLELEGHRVHLAEDGRSGIDLAREVRPDVILCDIGLPDLNGYEVARALRRDDALRSVRLVAVSGYARPEDRRRAADAGFDAHVAKPPAPEDLLSAIVATDG